MVNWLDNFLLSRGPDFWCSCRGCSNEILDDLIFRCLRELDLNPARKPVRGEDYEEVGGYAYGMTPWEQCFGSWAHLLGHDPEYAQTIVVSEIRQRLADLDRFTDENSLRAIQMIIEELPVEREFLIDSLHGSWAGKFLSKMEMKAALRRAKQEVNKVVGQLNEKIFAATRQIRRSSKAHAHRERVAKYRKLRFGKPIA